MKNQIRGVLEGNFVTILMTLVTIFALVGVSITSLILHLIRLENKKATLHLYISWRFFATKFIGFVIFLSKKAFKYLFYNVFKVNFIQSSLFELDFLIFVYFSRMIFVYG